MAAMLKYLRIGVTALGLTACVLFVALWVRSYWWVDTVEWHISNTSIGVLQSLSGRIWLYPSIPSVPSYLDAGLRLETRMVEERFTDNLPWYTRVLGIGFSKQPTFWAACLPHCFFIVVTGAFAIGPWLKWRFSLRSLLIATALIAVGLGIVVAL
jgi:hypothetical protein